MSLADVDPQHFRAALARWASGVTVVTARYRDEPVAMTASSFSSLSLDPPLVLVCVAESAHSHEGLVGAPGFTVHVLSRAQDDLSTRFARWDPGRWDGLQPDEGPFGEPLLPLGVARLSCAHHMALDGGDHTVLVGRVLQAVTSDATPLVYWNRGYRSVAD